MSNDKTTTIQVYKSDLTGRRLGAFSEPDDRGKKDELRRALDLLDVAEQAGVLDDLRARLDDEPSTPAQERAEKAQSDEGQIPLGETAQAPAPEHGQREAAQSDESGEAAFGSVEALVGDAETVETVDLPGRPEEVVERRREALRAAVSFIEGPGQAKAQDIARYVFEEFETDYSSQRSMWKNYLQPALAEIGEVELADAHEGMWRATGAAPVQK